MSIKNKALKIIKFTDILVQCVIFLLCVYVIYNIITTKPKNKETNPTHTTIFLSKYIYLNSQLPYNQCKSLAKIILNMSKREYSNPALHFTKLFSSKLEFTSFIVAIIHQESHFNPYSKSSKQAVGLMQVLYNVNKPLCHINSMRELYNPKTNIECGVNILEHHYQIVLKKHKNKKLTIDNMLCYMLNIYSGDRTGKYALAVLSKYKTLKIFLKEE